MDTRPSPAFSTAPARPTGVTLSDLLRILRRHLWMSVGITVVVAAVVFQVLSSAVPLYEARAKIGLQQGRRQVALSGQEAESEVKYNLLNSERDRIRSRPILDRTVELAGLAERPPYKGSGDPSSRLRGRVGVLISRDSWNMEVTVLDETAKGAKEILAELLVAYRAEQVRSDSANANAVLGFLDGQVDLAERGLAEARQAEAAYRRQHNILSDDASDNQAARRLGALDGELVRLQPTALADAALAARITAARESDQAQQRLLLIAELREVPSVAMAVAAQQVVERDRAAASLRYGPKHPRMVELEGLLASASAEVKRTVSVAAEQVLSRCEEGSKRVAELEQLVKQEQQALQDYQVHLAGLRALQQETANREKLWLDLRLRRDEQAVAGRMEATSIVEIEPPLANPVPVNIQRKLFLAAGLAAGGVTALLAIAALELSRLRLRGREELEGVGGLSCVATLPMQKSLRKDRRLFGVEVPEAYNFLATVIRMSLERHAGPGGRVLAISSATPGDGKTTVSIQLARTLARGGKKVLLIDADLRNPSVGKYLNLPPGPGLSFYLGGDDGITPQASVAEGLDVLGVGQIPPNPSALLQNGRLGQALERWRQVYDVVVIDTPPVLAATDALLIAQHSHGLLLVAFDHKTVRRSIRHAVERLLPVVDRLIGFVLNADRSGETIDVYGYGSGKK